MRVQTTKHEQGNLDEDVLVLDHFPGYPGQVTRIVAVVETGPATVRIGMEVEVESDSGTKRTFKIVETFEADPKAGLISDQSPVGKALMSHQEGDELTVATPGGVTNYTILSIRPMY